MTPEARDKRTSRWLMHAGWDMRTARKLLADPEAQPYQVAFLAQQAAEKAVKAALVYAGQEVPEIHNLNGLVGRLPAGWRTAELRSKLATLSSFAAERRYPDTGEGDVTPAEAQQAVKDAQVVQQWVRRDLEAHGYPFQPRTSPATSERPSRDDDRDTRER